MSKEEFFSILINIDDITTKNLTSNGISKYYISKFVSENVIERVEKGKYIIKDLKSLYSYGTKLLKKGLVNESIKCFNKC